MHYIVAIIVICYLLSLLDGETIATICFVLLVACLAFCIYGFIFSIRNKKYRKLRTRILDEIGNDSWKLISVEYDIAVSLKSKQALENYDVIKFFKEHRDLLEEVENIIEVRHSIANKIRNLINNSKYHSEYGFSKIKDELQKSLDNDGTYIIKAEYLTPAGKTSYSKDIVVDQDVLDCFKQDPSLLMSKTEYNRYLKELQKEVLEEKRVETYNRINKIITTANTCKEWLVIEDDNQKLDKLIGDLLRTVVGNIDKIKTSDSQAWDLIEQPINEAEHGVSEIVKSNEKLLNYYNSDEFAKVKTACKLLINSQKDFNDYIREKLSHISEAFGAKVVREQTMNDDQYSFIRPYQKMISPFTAEVSAQVFSSAENDPMKYIVKSFFPNPKDYPLQIQRLYKLIEELETLEDAKGIIENYKSEYKQYIAEVPSYVLINDESGFYSRLGFAVVNESSLIIKYAFVYTSAGGMAQRSFTVPMTIASIYELIKTLEGKLTAQEFTKRQRLLMTPKLREAIKERDNFTCCVCGNSVKQEPNLLLEIDHILPVSKGGETIESNLQTLCWKCNRRKAAKLIDYTKSR